MNLQNIKMQIFVIPAWIAGIQVCRMLQRQSMSAWIPALHAGMTQSIGLLKVIDALFARVFRERQEGLDKDSWF